jgi:hypothetical protein
MLGFSGLMILLLATIEEVEGGPAVNDGAAGREAAGAPSQPWVDSG